MKQLLLYISLVLIGFAIGHSVVSSRIQSEKTIAYGKGWRHSTIRYKVYEKVSTEQIIKDSIEASNQKWRLK